MDLEKAAQALEQWENGEGLSTDECRDLVDEVDDAGYCGVRPGGSGPWLIADQSTIIEEFRSFGGEYKTESEYD